MLHKLVKIVLKRVVARMFTHQCRTNRRMKTIDRLFKQILITMLRCAKQRPYTYLLIKYVYKRLVLHLPLALYRRTPFRVFKAAKFAVSIWGGAMFDTKTNKVVLDNTALPSTQTHRSMTNIIFVTRNTLSQRFWPLSSSSSWDCLNLSQCSFFLQQYTLRNVTVCQ